MYGDIAIRGKYEKETQGKQKTGPTQQQWQEQLMYSNFGKI
jgi:hypothetical protein